MVFGDSWKLLVFLVFIFIFFYWVLLWFLTVLGGSWWVLEVLGGLWWLLVVLGGFGCICWFLMISVGY